MPLNELFEKWLNDEVQEIEISLSTKMEFARMAFSAGRRIGKLEASQVKKALKLAIHALEDYRRRHYAATNSAAVFGLAFGVLGVQHYDEYTEAIEHFRSLLARRAPEGFAICAPELHAQYDDEGDIYCRMCGNPVSADPNREK